MVTVAPAAVWLLCLPQLEEDEGGQERGSWRQGGRRGRWAERWCRDKPHVQGWWAGEGGQEAGGMGPTEMGRCLGRLGRWMSAGT